METYTAVKLRRADKKNGASGHALARCNERNAKIVNLAMTKIVLVIKLGIFSLGILRLGLFSLGLFCLGLFSLGIRYLG